VSSARDGTNRLFIVEQPGRIDVLQPGATTPTVFLDITGKVLSGGEQGLLGLAFHPDYAVNRRFFVNYTRQPDGATVVAEYQASPSDPNTADPLETTLLIIPQPFANHNGGMIEFGPDGFLYIGMGDGGSGNDPDNRAQNIEDLLGKMLRIDIDHSSGTQAYSSPSDNPFVGSSGRDEIYAVGLRNPFRFSFDRATGPLFLGDVGQSAREEIDIITRGGNYGWRVFEGTLCTNLDPGLCNSAGFVDPIAEYDHSGGRCAILGGYVYRGARSTLPAGAYVYGDLCTGEILQLFPATNAGTQTVRLGTSLSISSFGEDEAGEIYVVGLGGTVDRITSSPPPPPCSYTISPASQDFTASGGAGQLTITTSSDCKWLAASHDPWITITTAKSGSGNANLSFSVGANTGTTARTGRMSIAGLTFTISQAEADPTASDGGGCFIATAAFGSPLAPQVRLLRAVRDRYLLPHPVGQTVVRWYYGSSPPLAEVIGHSEALRAIVRVGLAPLVGWAALALWSPALGLSSPFVGISLGMWLVGRRLRQGRRTRRWPAAR
jgi:hypothetical protein